MNSSIENISAGLLFSLTVLGYRSFSNIISKNKQNRNNTKSFTILYPTEQVKDSCRRVCSQAKYVTIDQNALDRLADEFIRSDVISSLNGVTW